MITTRRVLVLIGLVTLVACGSDESPPDPGPAAASASDAECPTEGGAFDDTKFYIEHNATDEDTGVHAMLAAEGWRSLCLTAPDGTRLVVADPQGPLGELGLADLLWESREPENDEYSLDDLRTDFPEGDYTVSGIDVDGDPLVGTAYFTHDIPAQPTITSPELSEDEEDAEEVETAALTVRWEPVTETVDGDAVTITGYEVIITDTSFEDPNGFSRPVYDVHVGPDATSLGVPAEFFDTGTLYELEVLALESSGNQTITVGFFIAS